MAHALAKAEGRKDLVKHAAKTCEEHRDYLREILKLQLWFVRHWLASRPDEDLSLVLRKRVDILRKTVFWRGQGLPSEADFEVGGWLALEEEIRREYEDTRSDSTHSAFELRAFPVVWRAVEPNLRHDYRSSTADRGFPCGSLRYDPPTATEPTLVHFHIANAVQPRSFFEDEGYLPECFACVMDKTEAQYGATGLGTSSWMNSYPRWLQLFPHTYAENMGPEREVSFGLGTWGQFVNARGAFNEKRARILRDTGRLPYPTRYSWCSFAAMRAHLIAYLDGPLGLADSPRALAPSPLIH